MAELQGVWVFFSQNFQTDKALSFGVVGNLGHDGAGRVNAFDFTSGAWTGFVKSTCEADDNDPSVNHLIVVDSGAAAGYVPHYTWSTNAYRWVDIKTSGGTKIADGDWVRVAGQDMAGGADDGFFALPLGFTFKYYGEDHDSVGIGTNGYITFGTEH